MQIVLNQEGTGHNIEDEVLFKQLLYFCNFQAVAAYNALLWLYKSTNKQLRACEADFIYPVTSFFVALVENILRFVCYWLISFRVYNKSYPLP